MVDFFTKMVDLKSHKTKSILPNKNGRWTILLLLLSGLLQSKLAHIPLLASPKDSPVLDISAKAENSLLIMDCFTGPFRVLPMPLSHTKEDLICKVLTNFILPTLWNGVVFVRSVCLKKKNLRNGIVCIYIITFNSQTSLKNLYIYIQTQYKWQYFMAASKYFPVTPEFILLT